MIESLVLQAIPIIPAKHFSLSRSFYKELGFIIRLLSIDVAEMKFGWSTFLLKEDLEYVDDLRIKIHVTIYDVEEFWRQISRIDLAGKYFVETPVAPKFESWGQKVAYLIDPSGFRWQFSEAP